MKLADQISLPTAEEIETIKPLIEAEFKNAGIVYGGFIGHPRGGLLLAAQVTKDEWHKLQNALFAHGIVMVDIARSIIAFAVRH